MDALHPQPPVSRAAPGRRSQRARHRLEVKYSLRRTPEGPKLLLVPPSLNRLARSAIGRAEPPTRPDQAVARGLAGCFAGALRAPDLNALGRRRWGGLLFF